jgi:oligoribonuclease (3'-5' exoribonuclease)
MTSTVLEEKTSINDSKSIIKAGLPYQVLHLASKFASKDQSRHILQYINCYKIASKEPSISNSIVIESTNGHYLFRWIGKVNDYYNFPSDKSILIHKDHFNKSDIKATNVDFYSDNTYQVWHATNKSFHTFQNGRDYGTYPNLEQLIPDKLDCLPGNGISFNSQYLALYFNAIHKYLGNNKVSTLFSNKPNKPIVFKSELDFNRLENTDVTFLIMPVQVRK